MTKRKPTYGWVRLGDAADYERFGDIYEAIVYVANYIAELVFADPAVRREVGVFRSGDGSGVDVEPWFPGGNGISLYVGDDQGNLVRRITRDEFEGFIVQLDWRVSEAITLAKTKKGARA